MMCIKAILLRMSHKESAEKTPQRLIMFGKESLLSAYEPKEIEFLAMLFYFCQATGFDEKSWLMEHFLEEINTAKSLPEDDDIWFENDSFVQVVAHVAHQKGEQFPEQAEVRQIEADVILSAWSDVLKGVFDEQQR